MKTIALVFLSIFLTKTCQNKKTMDESTPVAEVVHTKVAQKDIPTDKIQEGIVLEYEAMLRGFFKKIVFQNNQLTVSSDRSGETKITTLSKEDILEISNLLAGIDLDGFPKLKSPTEKRMYDGAAHANLNITVNGKTYMGTGFDHGFPPAAIEKLVSKLLSFSAEK